MSLILFDYQFVKENGCTIKEYYDRGPCYQDVVVGRLLMCLIWPISLPLWFVAIPIIKVPVWGLINLINRLHKYIVSLAFGNRCDKSTGNPYRDDITGNNK